MCPSGATCRLSHGLVSMSFSSTMKMKPNMTVDKGDITSSKCSTGHDIIADKVDITSSKCSTGHDIIADKGDITSSKCSMFWP